MNYTKPEVAVIGQAVRVIEQLIPHKPNTPFLDPGQVQRQNPAYDLDE
jgi:hypothetical protein